MRVRRGRTASTVVRRSGQVRTTTQSPAQGSASGSRAPSLSSAPPRLARAAPSEPSRQQTPRSTRVTRAGRWSGRSNRAYPAPTCSSQPSAYRSMVIGRPFATDGRRRSARGKGINGYRRPVSTDPLVLLAEVDPATARLPATAAALDGDPAAPSLLPGWTRGHVLTHIARNADGLRNLLVWARTGVVTPQYPNPQAREAGIAAGAGRPAGALAEDVEQSAAAFAAEAARVPASAWEVPVHGINGPDHPAWFTLFRRLTEVEIHHVDLRAGYAPPDWPELFVADQLEQVTGNFSARDDVPPCAIEVAGNG